MYDGLCKQNYQDSCKRSGTMCARADGGLPQVGDVRMG